MRLIDADALSKRLEALWNAHDDQDFANKDVWHELESAPAIDAVPQWIPCEESLPMVTEVVLIYVYYEFIDIGWVRSDGDWDTQFGVYDKRNITHWMPLPKPPKGEE